MALKLASVYHSNYHHLHLERILTIATDASGHPKNPVGRRASIGRRIMSKVE
jgi:hypothetical protein